MRCVPAPRSSRWRRSRWLGSSVCGGSQFPGRRWRALPESESWKPNRTAADQVEESRFPGASDTAYAYTAATSRGGRLQLLKRFVKSPHAAKKVTAGQHSLDHGPMGWNESVAWRAIPGEFARRSSALHRDADETTGGVAAPISNRSASAATSPWSAHPPSINFSARKRSLWCRARHPTQASFPVGRSSRSGSPLPVRQRRSSTKVQFLSFSSRAGADRPAIDAGRPHAGEKPPIVAGIALDGFGSRRSDEIHNVNYNGASKTVWRFFGLQ